MKTTAPRFLLLSILALIAASTVRADRFELSNGSTIIGKLVAAEGGKFTVETDFAGKIEIAQDRIKSFSTDDAVNVGLASGSSVLGKVAAADAGIKVEAAGGELVATPPQVTAVWRQGADSPAVRAAKEAAAKAERKWAYEASAAITGRSGASEKFGATLGFKATLASAQDKLIFNLQAERADDNGVKTADRQFGSVDYSSFFSPDNGWYARTSLEKDKIKALDLRSSTAFGFGRKLIKKDVQDLEVRIGMSYLYESYSNGTNFDSPGLDVTILHSYKFKNGRLLNTLTYTPTFEDFANYRVHHESSFEMPITASLWKLKLGLTNDYTSTPQPGVDRLDTLYFTSLILNWQ